MQLDDTLRTAIRKLLTTPPPKRRAKPQRAGLWSQPFHSDALGVNPDQIPEATAALRAAGVTADFDADGCAIITSDKQYREVARAAGLYNGRDGYGVPNSTGGYVLTGREQAKTRAQFRRELQRRLS